MGLFRCGDGGEWSNNWSKMFYDCRYGPPSVVGGKMYHVILASGERCIGKVVGVGHGGMESTVEINGVRYYMEHGGNCYFYTKPIETPATPPELDQKKMYNQTLLDRLEKVLPDIEAMREKAGVE